MKNAGVWVGAIMLGLAVLFFWQSFSLEYYGNYGPGPGFFPRWLSGIWIILSLLYIIDSVRKEIIVFKDIIPRGPGLKNVLVIFCGLIVFLVIVPFTGYILASVIMLFILFFRDYKWYFGLGISVVVTVALYVTFSSFLNVPLPVNSFGL